CAPGSTHGIGEQKPVYYVRYEDAKAFITALNSKGYGTFRLPTEVEWEYVNRAGSTESYSCGSEPACLEDYAWINVSGGTRDVGTKYPNEFGLYDMSGNVWEWVEDTYGYYTNGSMTDPISPYPIFYYGSPPQQQKIIRGGSWLNVPAEGRAARRYYTLASN